MKHLKNPVVFSIFVFILSLIFNQVYIGFRISMPLDFATLTAHLNAFFNDLFFAALIILVTINLPIIKKASRVILTFAFLLLTLMSIADICHFHVTLSRFNWRVMHNLNFYSIKASLNFQLFLVTGIYLALGITAVTMLFRNAQTVFSENLLNKLAISLLSAKILILFFLPVEFIPEKSNFTPIAMPIQGKNHFLRIISDGLLNGFLNFRQIYSGRLPDHQELNEKEISYLEQHGILMKQECGDQENKRQFKRIIMIVFESLAAEYLHSFNPDIPEETTDFFDKLIIENPSFLNYYSSDTPTINGINAMLLSKIPFTPHASKLRGEESLTRVLKNQHSFKSTFIRGVSKFYSAENLVIESIFGFDEQVTYEELATKYPRPALTDWGFHDDIIFAEAIQKLKENRNHNYFILAKTIDQHQPPHYCGVKPEFMPESVRSHFSPIVRSIFWANYCLKNFFAELEKEQLFDDQTLIVITSDHYPFSGFGHTELVKNPPFFQLGRIPLIFVTREKISFPPENLKKYCCQIDLAPTICCLTGAVPSQFFHGQNILKPSMVSRTLGFDADVIYWRNAMGNFSADVKHDIFPDEAVKKWFNNLFAIP
ncbi:MAG: LTA synthase family protein [Candidatus Rifleibacteriota bacterium]